MISLQEMADKGFKRNKSTATVGALLQSMIARAVDDNCYFY